MKEVGLIEPDLDLNDIFLRLDGIELFRPIKEPPSFFLPGAFQSSKLMRRNTSISILLFLSRLEYQNNLISC